MVKRHFWINRIEALWAKRSVLWLSGVRRAGKTFLCQSLDNVDYLDCELPRVRSRLEDPESFLSDTQGKRLVLDEIHRLTNPSELLKIAADHYPRTRIIATGSSTLAASSRFRDTLTGRKNDLWLTPMIVPDLQDFEKRDLRHRLRAGGLPPFFLADPPDEREFQEWIDSYWAKDIQGLFTLERRFSFQKLVELLMQQSGGIFEASSLAQPCEISRSSVSNYLYVLEATYTMHIVRPFHSRRTNEIISAPRVYGFDTGFVCHHKGWTHLRDEDLGLLFEHFVLNELHARLQTRIIYYWRDKQGHEVDFVVASQRTAPVAIECKWADSRFDPSSLLIFRKRYPKGKNFVVAQNVQKSYRRRYDDVEVRFVGLEGLFSAMGEVNV